MRVAVVGAGIAGIACARVLVEAGVETVVLDRGRVPGGRMASRRLAGRVVDLGASYFVPRDAGFQAVVDQWQAQGLARPWTDRFAVWDGGLPTSKTGPVRWAAPGGLRSLVATLATGLDVRQGAEVRQVGRRSVDGVGYDTVVLAMPDPQALQVLAPDLTAERAVIGDRAWQPVLALAARWDVRTWDWDGLFVHGQDVIDWVADDGSRRGDGAPVLVAHSTPDFAAGHLADPAAAAPELVAALRSVGLPDPAEVLRVQRWTYAKPVGTRPELFLLSDGIGLCGDGWGAAKVEAAWLSGTALGAALTAAG